MMTISDKFEKNEGSGIGFNHDPKFQIQGFSFQSNPKRQTVWRRFSERTFQLVIIIDPDSYSI